MNHPQPDTLIRNPNGNPITASVEIRASASRVWAVAGEFAGFDRFIPALERIEMTGQGPGSLRTKFFKDGNLVVEQLNHRDEQAMTMTWTTLYSTLGVGQLWAAMVVEAAGADCSRATWTIIAEPTQGEGEGEADAFAQFVQGFADEAMGNLRTLFA